MTQAVNGASSSGSWGRVGGDKNEAQVGQGINRSIEETPGRVILGVKQQMVRQSGKTLQERTTQVLKQLDTFMLQRGAGGVRENGQISSELKQGVKVLTHKAEKFQKAGTEFSTAAGKLERLRDTHGWDAKPGFKNGLQSAERALVKAEKAVRDAGEGLSDAQDNLELSVGAAENHKSALEGFYTPKSVGMFGKQDKEVFEIRLVVMQGLEVELNKGLASQMEAVASGDDLAKLEAARIGQQLVEVGASKLALHERLGRGKKFHDNNAATTKASGILKHNLLEAHGTFQAALTQLRGARRDLDRTIISGQKPGSKLRTAAEERYKKAETTVSQKAVVLKAAEKNYSSGLKQDRKMAVPVKKSTVKKESPPDQTVKKQAKPKAQSSVSQPKVQQQQAERNKQPAATKAAPPDASKDQAASPRYPQTTPQTAQDINRAREALKMGRRTTNGKRGIQLLADRAQSMQTLQDVVKLRLELKQVETKMKPAEMKTLRLLMNSRIVEMMKHHDFADKNSFSFIDRHVYGREGQRLVSSTRLNTLTKGLNK